MRYNLLLISGDTRLTERLQAALSAECAIMPADRQDNGQALAQRMEPDGIIVDAGSHPGARTVLESISTFRTQFPEHPLMVIGDEMSAQMILASFRAGADDFLDRDSPDGEIHAAILSRLRDRALKQGQRPTAVRFDILSPGPADEDYDLALNLAVLTAAEDRARRVLLVDLSLPASPIRLALGIEPGLTIPLAIRELRRLDRAFFDSALSQSPETGLCVLPLADQAVDMAALPALQDLSILLQIIRTMFDVVVVYWGLFSRQAVLAGGDGSRRQILLCCNQRFSSVRNAKMLLAELKSGGTPTGDLVLAVHQLAPNATPTPDDIVRAVGAERSIVLRTGWPALAQAHNQGRPLGLQGPSAYVSTLRAHLASGGLLQPASEPRASNLLQWLRKARAS
jgi:Flp pilus assembly CpaE family ATPase